MLDSMTWPVFAGLGDWVIPVAWILALLTGVRLARSTASSSGRPGSMPSSSPWGHARLPRLVFMYNGESPTSHLNWTLVDFAEAQFLGLHTASWFLLAVSLACGS
jgi:ribose transport system permease protein